MSKNYDDEFKGRIRYVRHGQLDIARVSPARYQAFSFTLNDNENSRPPLRGEVVFSFVDSDVFFIHIALDDEDNYSVADRHVIVDRIKRLVMGVP